jgi:hypothetical protein
LRKVEVGQGRLVLLRLLLDLCSLRVITLFWLLVQQGALTSAVVRCVEATLE